MLRCGSRRGCFPWKFQWMFPKKADMKLVQFFWWNTPIPASDMMTPTTTKQVLSSTILCLLSLVSLLHAQSEIIKCPQYEGDFDLWRAPKPVLSAKSRKTGLTFSLVSEPTFSCNTTTFKKTVTWEPNAKKSSLAFYPDGNVYIDSYGIYTKDQFCLSQISNSSVEITVCKIQCGVTHNCLKKCCTPGKTFPDKNISTCADGGSDDILFYSHEDHSGCGTNSSLPFHFQYLKRWFAQNKSCGSETERVQRLLSDGTLATYSSGKWYKETNFCVERPLTDSSQLVVCKLVGDKDEEYEDTTDWKFIFLASLLGISMVFLIMTVLVYILIWEKHNIHGWTVFAFVLNMLAFFLVLLCLHATANNANEELLTSNSCAFLAYAHHFLYIATTCWMSVINADLWLTFRSLTPPTRTKMLQRFSMYIGFATLFPVLIILLGVILTHSQHLFTYEECGIESRTVSLPGYATDRCTLSSEGDIFYLYIPVGILLFSNVVMFSSTVLNLWRYRETTRNALSNSSSSNERQSLFLFLKLFFVMGITWVFELISRICSHSLNENNNGYTWLFWVPFDLLNFFQAVSIFFIFAAKRENLLFISRKYPSTRYVLHRVFRWWPCRIPAVDIEQTEMTMTERGTMMKGRFSSFVMTTRKLSTFSTNSNSDGNRRKLSVASTDKVEGKNGSSSAKGDDHTET